MLLHEITSEDLPLFYSIIKNGIEKERALYFDSGAHRIAGIKTSRVAGKQIISLSLARVKPPHNTQPYTIWESQFDDWTLEKFKDGHALRMRKTVAEAFVDSVEDEVPFFAKLIQNRLDKNQPVYFGAKSVITGIRVSSDNNIVWVDLNGGGGKQVYTITSPRYNDWTLVPHLDGIKLKGRLKEALGSSEPLIITLMNQTLNNKGAVKVELHGGDAAADGWITAPFLQKGDFWRGVAVKPSTKKKVVLILYDDADEKYTLTKNKAGKLVLKYRT